MTAPPRIIPLGDPADIGVARRLHERQRTAGGPQTLRTERIGEITSTISPSRMTDRILLEGTRCRNRGFYVNATSDGYSQAFVIGKNEKTGKWVARKAWKNDVSASVGFPIRRDEKTGKYQDILAHLSGEKIYINCKYIGQLQPAREGTGGWQITFGGGSVFGTPTQWQILSATTTRLKRKTEGKTTEFEALILAVAIPISDVATIAFLAAYPTPPAKDRAPKNEPAPIGWEIIAEGNTTGLPSEGADPLTIEGANYPSFNADGTKAIFVNRLGWINEISFVPTFQDVPDKPGVQEERLKYNLTITDQDYTAPVTGSIDNIANTIDVTPNPEPTYPPPLEEMEVSWLGSWESTLNGMIVNSRYDGNTRKDITASLYVSSSLESTYLRTITRFDYDPSLVRYAHTNVDGFSSVKETTERISVDFGGNVGIVDLIIDSREEKNTTNTGAWGPDGAGVSIATVDNSALITYNGPSVLVRTYSYTSLGDWNGRIRPNIAISNIGSVYIPRNDTHTLTMSKTGAYSSTTEYLYGPTVASGIVTMTVDHSYSSTSDIYVSGNTSFERAASGVFSSHRETAIAPGGNELGYGIGSLGLLSAVARLGGGSTGPYTEPIYFGRTHRQMLSIASLAELPDGSVAVPKLEYVYVGDIGVYEQPTLNLATDYKEFTIHDGGDGSRHDIRSLISDFISTYNDGQSGPDAKMEALPSGASFAVGITTG